MPAPEQTEEDGWKRVWNARICALNPILGRQADRVFHSAVPMCFGGFADVVPFPDYLPGMTYVTVNLTGEDVGQLPTSLGNYELMVCVREESSRAADLISRLARYTCEAELEPGESMDLKDFFGSSVIEGLLFTHPGDQPVEFEFLGQRYGLLLCIGITGAELAFKHAHGADPLLALLRERGVFPYTVLQRESVTP
jgi:hypothetical protein